MNREHREISFDDALNDCMDRIMRGESLEDCLKLYPHYAAEIKPLLETAIRIRKKATDISLREELKESIRKLLKGEDKQDVDSSE